MLHPADVNQHQQPFEQPRLRFIEIYTQKPVCSALRREQKEKDAFKNGACVYECVYVCMCVCVLSVGAPCGGHFPSHHYGGRLQTVGGRRFFFSFSRTAIILILGVE